MSKTKNFENDLLSNVLKTQKPPAPQTPEITALVRRELGSKRQAKWTTLEKVNVLLSSRQKDLLDSLAKQVMRRRKEGLERITANAIIRCLIDVLGAVKGQIDFSDIRDERELFLRIQKHLLHEKDQ